MKFYQTVFFYRLIFEFSISLRGFNQLLTRKHKYKK